MAALASKQGEQLVQVPPLSFLAKRECGCTPFAIT